MCKLLSYIIVAIIIALVIHLLSKLVKRTTEKMTSVSNSSNCHVGKIMNTSTADGMSTLSPAMDFEDRIMGGVEGMIKSSVSPIVEGMTNVSSPKEVETVQNAEPALEGKPGCTVCKTSTYVDDYIRESLLHKALVCRNNKEYNAEEVNKHFDETMAFRNSVNQTSNSDDLVDRINNLYLSGNNDVSRNHKDVKISDMFNELTSGQNIYSKGCNRLPLEDGKNATADYVITGHDNDLLSQDHWVYGEEKVMNGGEFMGGVWPNDSIMQEQNMKAL